MKSDLYLTTATVDAWELFRPFCLSWTNDVAQFGLLRVLPTSS